MGLYNPYTTAVFAPSSSRIPGPAPGSRGLSPFQMPRCSGLRVVSVQYVLRRITFTHSLVALWTLSNSPGSVAVGSPQVILPEGGGNGVDADAVDGFGDRGGAARVLSGAEGEAGLARWHRHIALAARRLVLARELVRCAAVAAVATAVCRANPC
eukprot:7377755-Prymnesium_polylepis.2